MSTDDIALIGHLMRRAGFGATGAELEAYAVNGYEPTAERLLDMSAEDEVPIDLLRRYHPDHFGMIGGGGMTAYWLFRMINGKKPLQKKMDLAENLDATSGDAEHAVAEMLRLVASTPG